MRINTIDKYDCLQIVIMYKNKERLCSCMLYSIYEYLVSNGNRLNIDGLYELSYNSQKYMYMEELKTGVIYRLGKI